MTPALEREAARLVAEVRRIEQDRQRLVKEVRCLLQHWEVRRHLDHVIEQTPEERAERTVAWLKERRGL